MRMKMKMIICRIRISKSNTPELGGLALRPRRAQERMMIFVGGTSDNWNYACAFETHFIIVFSSPFTLCQFHSGPGHSADSTSSFRGEENRYTRILYGPQLKKRDEFLSSFFFKMSVKWDVIWDTSFVESWSICEIRGLDSVLVIICYYTRKKLQFRIAFWLLLR